MPEHYYISSNKFSTQERQTKRGKVYDIIFRIVTLDGCEKQKKLSGFKTKGEAKEAYLNFVQEHCELVKNNPIKKKKRLESLQSDQTVAELIPVYITSLGNQNKDSSIVDKSYLYRLYIIPQLGTFTLAELTKERLFQWQDELWVMKNPKTGDYYSYQYLSKIRNALSSFLTWLSNRYNYNNELPKVKKPRKRLPKVEMQFWTREEFDQFISVVDNPTYRALFSVLFFTGRRKGEVLALQKDDVTQKGIKFNKTYSRKTLNGAAYNIASTKNERSGITTICEPLQRELSVYTPQSPFYFGGKAPIHENTVSHAFDRYILKADVRRIRMHDLRHSFVSMCIHLGANVYVVADLIGDTPEQVLKTYGHLYSEDKQKIIDKIR